MDQPVVTITNLESAVVRRLMWRLLPFLFLLYIVAYLDRINVSYAILQMRGQLHLSERAYGNAAGIFFLGYFLFQVPSNLVLQRVGVRRWICGLMVTWGIISCSMIFIRGPRSFYTLRFLLGAAEAGFFPGMIFYMKSWFPANARARAVAWFMTANPLAGVVGSPISGALMELRGGGLEGWQWLFLIEGVPAIVLGALVLWVLTDRPEDATWLTEPQRNWLVSTLGREHNEGDVSISHSASTTFTRVGMLSLVYFAVPACMYGVTFWLPTAIRNLSNLSFFGTGVLAAIPYLVTVAAMVWVAMHSDRSGERRWHTAIPALLAAASLGVAAYAGSSWVAITGMSVAMIGAQSMNGPFWAMATSKMSGTAAGIAAVNALGNLGGFFGPYIIGVVRSGAGGFRGGLLAISATLMISGWVALMMESGFWQRERSAHQ